jgi:hypothetical protein
LTKFLPVKSRGNLIEPVLPHEQIVIEYAQDKCFDQNDK